MSTTITSALFYDEFTSTGGGGSPYMNGNVGDKMRVEIEGYFSRVFEDVRVRVDAEANTMTMLNNLDPRSFAGEGFYVGCQIEITGTASNNGEATITAISEDGRTITFTSEFSVNDEDAESVTFGDISAPTEIDLYFNLIPNSSPETYVSLTDVNSLQRLYAPGFDAEVSTPVKFRIGTKSFAWVTNEVENEDTGQVGEVEIVGEGVADYRYWFTITHEFFVTPLFLVSQKPNFVNNVSPEYYLQGSSLKYICRIEARAIPGSPDADHTGGFTSPKGTGNWYDGAAKGARPEYYVSAVTYQDDDTSEALDRLDVNKNVLVTITINSRNDRFVNQVGETPGTEMVLGFHACPGSEQDYQDTDTTYRQNFFFDRVFSTVGAVAEDGEFFGTDYQVITDCEFDFVSAGVVTCTFIFSAGSALASYWQGKADSDRDYVIFISTQGTTFTTTKNHDRVSARADFQSADFDKTDTTLVQLVGTGIMAFEYPDTGMTPVGSIEGLSGDPWYVEIPFRVKKTAVNGETPTVQTISFQVVAQKTGEQDFVIEEKVVDCSQMKKLLGVQQLDISEERGFITYAGDPCNEVVVSREDAYDTETYAGYTSRYGLALRYESWMDALSLYLLSNAGSAVPAITKYIDQISQDWSRYNNVQGWNLFFRWNITVRGVDGFDNDYFSQIPVKVTAPNVIIWEGGDLAYSYSLKYYLADGSEEVGSILLDEKTLVRATYTGGFTLPDGAGGYYGWMAANASGGTVFDRRFASSEIPSETSSPWSATDEDPDADESYALGNIRINIYYGEKVVLEGLFDATLYGQSVSTAIIHTRFGAKYVSS